MALFPAPDALQRARDAFARRDWVIAHQQYLEARGWAPLDAEDLMAFADSAWWLGSIQEAVDAYQGAYTLYIDQGQPRPASYAAIAIGYTLALRREESLASGWFSRARRLLVDDADCVERAYLDYVDIEFAYAERQYDEVVTMARLLQESGARFKDPNLTAMGILAEGLALIRQGNVRRGMVLLDEAMLAALSDDLGPDWAGSIYCHLMVICHELGDIPRAATWTRATSEWCETLTAHGPFLGICRVHRAYVHYLQGDWELAEQNAQVVCTGMIRFDIGCVAEAYYQLGELQRMRGNLAAAAEAYGKSRDLGGDPQPGFALHLLALGHRAEARKSIRAALATQPTGQPERVKLLAALIDVALELGDVDGAIAAANEIDEIAMHFASSGLDATSRHVKGATILAQGDASAALPVLRDALQRWQSLEAPYESARIHVLIAKAYQALGDTRAAEQELDAAAPVFVRLGALPDIRIVDRMRVKAAFPQNLSEREAQVLVLVAAGKTNREIGQVLFISPRTVARHIENVYTKLSISSRSAATAWCMEHGLRANDHG